MRIGIIGTRGIPNSYGGFERFVEQLVDDPVWPASGIEFAVYGEGADARFNDWTVVRSVGTRKRSHPMQYYARSVVSAARDCDVILCCGVALSVFSLWPGIRGRRLIVNVDGCEWRRTKWSPFARLAVRMMYWPACMLADTLVIDAEALRDDFGRLLGSKARYIAYQAPEPTVSELSATTRDKITRGRPYVLVIARLEPENNILASFEAYARLGDPSVDLLIVGAVDTPYYEAVLRNAERPGIRFLGAIFDQPVLNELRSNCVAYVHGHSVGGTNPSLLEALATVRGRLVCHDNKYNREVAGSQAEYFADAESLAGTLRMAIADPRDRLGTPMFRQPTSDARFQPAHIARRYRELFLGAVGGYEHPAGEHVRP